MQSKELFLDYARGRKRCSLLIGLGGCSGAEMQKGNCSALIFHAKEIKIRNAKNAKVWRSLQNSLCEGYFPEHHLRFKICLYRPMNNLLESYRKKKGITI